VTLKGQGVSPKVSLSVRDGIMDMGAVITGEYREETFQVEKCLKILVNL